jgi:hypothetical protein
MSSYAVTVLTPRPFTDEDKLRVANFISALADEADPAAKTSFHICSQPFDFEFPPLDEEQARIDVHGWSPKGALQLGTYCGSPVNHIMLGVLSSRLARMFNGWIELDGALSQATNNLSVLSYDGAAGRLRTPSGGDVISPSLMDYWLGFADFRLV